MTKHLITVLLIFLPTSLVAAAKPFIVSGFDDVLRQAENTGLLKATLKIFEKDKTFSGMSELYNIISQEETDPNFVVVSAISSWFDSRINHFLHDSKFPTNRRYLRNWLTQWSIEKFKIDKIASIIKERPHRKFIVIFDNSDASIKLTKIIHEKFADHVEAIYLREVVEKKTPAGAVSFFTAFDIALNEFTAERLNLTDVERIGQAILQEMDVAMLFPAYSVCPSSYNPCDHMNSSVLNICEKVRAHVVNLCHP